MRGVCGRPGCDEPATSTFGFDGGRGVVWLHPIDEPEGTGFLCTRHADSLVVPRGWTVHDRRKPSRRTAKRPASASEQASEATQRASARGRGIPGRSKRAKDKVPVAPAPPTLPFPERSARALRRPAWAQRDAADDPVDALLEVASPLLSRAFRNARST